DERGRQSHVGRSRCERKRTPVRRDDRGAAGEHGLELGAGARIVDLQGYLRATRNACLTGLDGCGTFGPVTTRIAHLLLLLGVGLACAGAPGGKATGPVLRDGLTTDCLGFPAQEPSAGHHAEVATFLTTGEEAVDFTLRDVEGRPWTL